MFEIDYFSPIVSEEESSTSSSITMNESLRDSSGTTQPYNLADLCITPEIPSDVNIALVNSREFNSPKYYWRTDRTRTGTARYQETTVIYRSVDLEPSTELFQDVLTPLCATISSNDEEEDCYLNRGVLTIHHQRETIFVKELEVQTKDLPRRKPKITIDRRMLEIEDD